MDLNKMIMTLKEHQDSDKMGMIASHLGMVRKTSPDGREVTGLEVIYDQNIIQDIINDIKKMPGIIEVLIELKEGPLKVGDEVMVVAVGGDVRENVFAGLIHAVNRIKAEACKKKEFFR